MSYIDDFKKSSNLSPSADLSAVLIALEAVYEANKISENFIGNIDNKTNKDGLVVHSHLNILGRIFEQTQGMLVCISTNCPTSAEAIARVVVEGSINLIYMSERGSAATLIGFFDSWLSEHKRKLQEWKEASLGKEYENYVSPMITERLDLVLSYEAYLNIIVSSCNIERKPHREVWPKSLFERFRELGRENDYYESYHRLSAIYTAYTHSFGCYL